MPMLSQRQRIEALTMLSRGVSVDSVAWAFNCHRNTINSLRSRFQQLQIGLEATGPALITLAKTAIWNWRTLDVGNLNAAGYINQVLRLVAVSFITSMLQPPWCMTTRVRIRLALRGNIWMQMALTSWLGLLFPMRKSHWTNLGSSRSSSKVKSSFQQFAGATAGSAGWME